MPAGCRRPWLPENAAAVAVTRTLLRKAQGIAFPSERCSLPALRPHWSDEGRKKSEVCPARVTRRAETRSEEEEEEKLTRLLQGRVGCKFFPSLLSLSFYPWASVPSRNLLLHWGLLRGRGCRDEENGGSALNRSNSLGERTAVRVSGSDALVVKTKFSCSQVDATAPRGMPRLQVAPSSKTLRKCVNKEVCLASKVPAWLAVGSQSEP